MGGGGGTNTVQKSDPWGPAAMRLQGQVLPDAAQMYRQGGFAPIAGPSGATQAAEQNMMRTANKTPFLDQVGYDDVKAPAGYKRLDAVKENALGSVLPGVMSQFAGGGMADSSLAVDTASRAAMEAVAPIEYGAFNAQQDRKLQADLANQGAALRFSAMAPMFEQARYMPAQMQAQVGMQRDARRDERAAQGLTNLTNYSNMVSGIGGAGQTMTMSGGGPSTGQSALGGAMGGAATGAMIGGPYGALIGGGLGLLGGLI